MTEIDVIMGMLDWNNSAEEQAAGLAQAAQVENFQVFFAALHGALQQKRVGQLRKSSGNAVGCGIRRLFGKPVGMAARHELAGRFSHPRRLQAFSELGGAPSGDRGKAFCARRRLGTRYGRRISENCKIVKTRYLHRMRGGPTCAKLIWNWIIVPNANRRKRRTHFLHRNTAF